MAIYDFHKVHHPLRAHYGLTTGILRAPYGSASSYPLGSERLEDLEETYGLRRHASVGVTLPKDIDGILPCSFTQLTEAPKGLARSMKDRARHVIS
jgi:hypothetical protein